MQVFYFIKKRRILVTLTLAILLIISILSAIYYIDSSKQISNSTVGSDLKGYSQLRQKINNLAQDPTIGQSPIYKRIINNFQILEDKTASEGARYNALKYAGNYFQELYSITNDHKLYYLPLDFVNVARSNFPKYYKSYEFAKVLCIDQTCAEEPQPKEILTIINEIKSNKDIPEGLKENLSRDLLNPGYLGKRDADTKAFAYLIMASILKNNGFLAKTGRNIVLSEDLINYVKKTYSKEYNKLASPSPTSGIIKNE